MNQEEGDNHKAHSVLEVMNLRVTVRWDLCPELQINPQVWAATLSINSLITLELFNLFPWLDFSVSSKNWQYNAFTAVSLGKRVTWETSANIVYLNQCEKGVHIPKAQHFEAVSRLHRSVGKICSCKTKSPLQYKVNGERQVISEGF